MPDINYLRVDFRVISEKLNEAEIRKAFNLGTLIQILNGTSEFIEGSRTQELKVSGKLDGDNRWEIFNQAIDWARNNDAAFSKIHMNADIRFDTSIVCNIKRMKNPVPEVTKELIQRVVGAEFAFRNLAKEKAAQK